VHYGHQPAMSADGSTPVYPITAADTPEPRDWYSVMKLMSENAGRMYANTSPNGMQVVAVRFGWAPRTADDCAAMETVKADGRSCNEYLSPRDAGACVRCCVTASLPDGFRYGLIFAQSRPMDGFRGRFDMSLARELVGFEPQDKYPDGIEEIRGDTEYKVSPLLYSRPPEQTD